MERRRRKRQRPKLRSSGRAAEMFKRVAGIDDRLVEFKEDWEDWKVQLKYGPLRDGGKHWRAQVMEAYESLTRKDACEFMTEPYEEFCSEDPGGVRMMLVDLDRLDVPGAALLLEAVSSRNSWTLCSISSNSFVRRRWMARFARDPSLLLPL